MDKLTTFLAGNKETLSAFAVRIGRSPSTLTRVLNGSRDPSVSLAEDVAAGTGGVLSASEFLALCIERKTKLKLPEAAE